jgi:S-methylmethionine-dependent homocysteine/selenocysteine methylase
MPTRSILDRLSEGEVLLMDGGTGTELQRRGVNVAKGSSITRRPYTTSKGVTTEETLGVWSAAANVDAPSVVRNIHEDYLRLGADIIISNNFYTSQAMMAIVGQEERWEEYTRLGGELAVQARDEVNAEAYVAGGFAPPYDGDLREEFEGQARVLAGAGVDVMLPEYLAGSSVHDTPISDCITAVDACATTGLPVFLGICNISEKGTLRRGESYQELVAALKGHAVDGILLMCSSPEEISACLPSLRKAFDGPVGAYGNLNYAWEDNPKWGSSPDEPLYVLDIGEYTPKRYAEFAGQWKEMGAQIIGGCCGTTLEHIEALRPVVKP